MRSTSALQAPDDAPAGEEQGGGAMTRRNARAATERDAFQEGWPSAVFERRFAETIEAIGVEKAAEICGLAVGTIRCQRPSVRTVFIVAREAEVSIDWLFGRDQR